MQDHLNFLFEIDELKSVLRKTKLYNGSRFENSAEHSWNLAMGVMLFHEMSNEPIDLNKAIKMALIHDVVEIYSGDVFLYDPGHDNSAEEVEAAHKIFALVPDLPLMEELKALWFEFEERKTSEAKFVKALDRFLPLTQNWKTEGYSWKENGIRYEQVLKANAYMKEGSERLWEQAQVIFDDCRKAGNLLD